MRTFSEFLLEANTKNTTQIVPGSPKIRPRVPRTYQSGVSFYNLPQADTGEEKPPEYYSWEGHNASRPFDITYQKMQETLNDIINIIENIGLKIDRKKTYEKQDFTHFNNRYQYAEFEKLSNGQENKMKILGVHRKALTNSYRSYNLSSNNVALVLEQFQVITPTKITKQNPKLAQEAKRNPQIAQYLRSCVDIDVNRLKQQIKRFKENLTKYQEGEQAKANMWNTFTNIKDKYIAGGQATASIKTSSQTNS